MTDTHLLVKVNSVAHEGGMVDKAEACPVLWYVALEQQLLIQLNTNAGLKHFGVQQAVDHEDQVVVELTEGLAADVKGLLKNRIKIENEKKDNKRKWRKRDRPTSPLSISAEGHI